MNNTLQHRTAVVTGSTSGIGAATVRALAEAGARVVVSGRDAVRGEKLADEVGGAFVPVDLAGSYRQIRDFAAEATDRLGGHVDILVNNAGIYPFTSTADLPDADLDAMLAVNVRAPHVLTGALAPAMAARGDGVIVNIGSWMSHVGVPAGAMYTATKAAIAQMTRTWSAEFGPRGVRVVTVSPGITLTPGNEAALAMIERQTADTPAGTYVRPEQIAAAVRFVASPEGAMIQGTGLLVDGGLIGTRLAF
ncbi:SDR family NAD(P)-dependent oxidoreductase [Catenuloplanes atrovinosus]|uniref:NAD(P)-dependent dehydrogenase (Short-subunit alcohol dehydrogenase family) n=1 Tax=Catenuloplanes atrovinosus TaxID=137266 RepID=A0AAE3YLE2_9ACTN|nr:SDR family oxidoreductase [Catenuloplanes atrovinosus]MDR7275978.1 NAD(P)-dependent dehydrogenase (short-subunit alcohol dehydrogenase family) [Catenuloplanes atrovinosus]